MVVTTGFTAALTFDATFGATFNATVSLMLLTSDGVATWNVDLVVAFNGAAFCVVLCCSGLTVSFDCIFMFVNL